MCQKSNKLHKSRISCDILKLHKLLSALLVVIAVISGCGQSKDSDSQANTNGGGSEKKFIIVTSFYPMYISTINVAKDVPGVEVINMTKPQAGCLHDYQLTPEDLKMLEAADVFVVNGAGMETFMDKVIIQQKNMKIIEASKGIELIMDADGEVNPHVWVSITNAIVQVKNISEQLAAADPTNASQYESNTDEYVEKLEALKDKMHKSLDGIKNKDIITFHEAFPYFAKEFGLNIVAVIEREPGAAPTPKELEDTIDIVNNHQIKALFTEPQYSSKAADIIAGETGAGIYGLDPVVTGDSKPDGYDEYINVMGLNLKSLEEALK